MDFVTLAQTLGVATACLAALGWAIYKVAGWFGETVLKPLVAKHIEFLDVVKTQLVRQTEILQAQEHTSTEHLQMQHEETRVLEGLSAGQQVTIAKLQAIYAATEAQSGLLERHHEMAEALAKQILAEATAKRPPPQSASGGP